MKILVTGAGGLVGRLVTERAATRHDLLALRHEDLDVTDRSAVGRVVAEFSPDAVLHCAAHTDVDGTERDPERAMVLNADAAGWVADAACKRNAAIVYVSTDYVFDGQADEPYREGDPTAPLSSYGRSKLEGERRVASACPDHFIIVRTGWLYGPGRGFVDWARARLEASQELRVVDDQTGSPTYAGELAAALLRLAEGGHFGLFHFVNRGEATWFELGRAVAEELSLDTGVVQPIKAEALARPAERPAYSALAVDRYEEITGTTVTSWRDALNAYLSED